jgi:hypothetical protein
MKDMQAQLGKLLVEASECALIASLATDKRKRGLFTKLAEHYSVLASEVKRAIEEATIPKPPTIVQCNCGAEYRRTEEKFLIPHTGDAICTVCGSALESWHESTHVPSYELIERADRKPER